MSFPWSKSAQRPSRRFLLTAAESVPICAAAPSMSCLPLVFVRPTCTQEPGLLRAKEWGTLPARQPATCSLPVCHKQLQTPKCVLSPRLCAAVFAWTEEARFSRAVYGTARVYSNKYSLRDNRHLQPPGTSICSYCHFSWSPLSFLWAHVRNTHASSGLSSQNCRRHHKPKGCGAVLTHALLWGHCMITSYSVRPWAMLSMSSWARGCSTWPACPLHGLKCSVVPRLQGEDPC